MFYAVKSRARGSEKERQRRGKLGEKYRGGKRRKAGEMLRKSRECQRNGRAAKAPTQSQDRAPAVFGTAKREQHHHRDSDPKREAEKNTGRAPGLLERDGQEILYTFTKKIARNLPPVFL